MLFLRAFFYESGWYWESHFLGGGHLQPYGWDFLKYYSLMLSCSRIFIWIWLTYINTELLMADVNKVIVYHQESACPELQLTVLQTYTRLSTEEFCNILWLFTTWAMVHYVAFHWYKYAMYSLIHTPTSITRAAQIHENFGQSWPVLFQRSMKDRFQELWLQMTLIFSSRVFLIK